jgi:hypothetical protein
MLDGGVYQSCVLCTYQAASKKGLAFLILFLYFIFFFFFSIDTVTLGLG